MKYFTSMEDVQAFAQSVKFNNPDSIRMPWMPKSDFAGLEVEGFSRIVPCFVVRQTYDHFQKTYLDEYYYDASYWLLEIIPTGELFSFYERARRSKRFALQMHNRLNSDRCRYFTFSKEAPNAIGKATEKKLQEWIDYLHEYRAAQELYLSSAMEKNRKIADAFREKYPEGVFRTDADGWTSEFTIRFERLRIKFIACEDGGFTRNVDVPYDCYPTTEELLS